MDILEVQPVEIIQSYANTNSYILVLLEPNSKLNIPILIGEHEAQIIILAKEKLTAARPLTHNLICEICKEFSLELQNIVIEKFVEGIFYSTLYITDGITTKKIDSRTSDAIALALSLGTPIYVTEKVLKETGILTHALAGEENQNIIEIPTIEDLEVQLKAYERNEEYEKAAEIMKRITQMHQEEREKDKQ